VTLTDEEVPFAWREYHVSRLPSREIVAIYYDVTEKKRAEEDQKALQQQLLVSQKMESIGTFAGGTAHNFRNILQAISGNIEYLEMLYDEESQIKDVANNIYDSVEKGVGLINSLLHFSKRGGESPLEDLDLADVIMKTHEIVERIFDKKIRIHLNVDRHLFVRGNLSLLSQAFMNLLTNARDAMPEGGELSIEAKRTKHKVLATVSDTGIGMEKDVLDKIFDPFFTLKDVGKGTGLGLTTTHGIVEQHGGSIRVSSRPGRGTTFKINFPLVKRAGLEEPEPEREPVYGQGQRILIVDDEPSALDALSHLTEHLGYETLGLNRPSEALERYEQWSPDLVLMDRSMPGIDGVTCIQRLVKTDPKARIVVVSGYEESGPDGIDDTVRQLIKGYITKPCGIKELSHVLAQALKE
jgi:nitrogen-specific signal transduction histidine kinase/ActR/RegA family two-component response regulator